MTLAGSGQGPISTWSERTAPEPPQVFINSGSIVVTPVLPLLRMVSDGIVRPTGFVAFAVHNAAPSQRRGAGLSKPGA